MRKLFTAAALVSAVVLAGCDSINGFDPLDKLSDLDIMGSSKKPLLGDRRAVFPEGTPGVPQGVPPELVKGYQAPVEEPPPAVVAAKPKPVKARPKKVAAAPVKRAQRPQAQQQDMQQAPASQQQGRTTTQQVGQSAGQMQQMPGSQPAWPTNAQPAPGPWTGPQR